MKLHNLSVGAKLWALVLGLMVAMMALLVGTQTYLARVDAATMHAAQLSEERAILAMQWKGMTELAVDRLITSVTSYDPDLVKTMQAKVKADVEAISVLQKQLEGLVFTQDGRDAFARTGQARTVVLEITGRIQKVSAEGDLSQAQRLVDENLTPAVAQYSAAQQAFVDLQQKHKEEARAQGERDRRAAMWLGLGLGVAVMLVGLLLAWLLVRSITQPLHRAVGLADQIAAGDLTADVHENRGDELGQLLRSLSAMSAQLRTVVGEVRSGVESVSTAANEIAEGNHDLSARTEQTAANLEETAASMEQLTATVTQSADTARQANQLVSNAAQAAERGGQVVQQVVSSMAQITQSSHKISDIIGVIDSIAFQTNILALNAAVEAARAGEQGRGFAVVAGEVRSLAQRSAEAAKEIKQLITTSVDSVQAGSQQVELAGQSMTEIVQGVRHVSDLIGEITASSTEQRDGINEVNQAVTNLDQMTQQNAALVEQASAAAASMREQSQRLAQVVSVFNVGTGAARSVAAPTSAPAAKPLLPKAATRTVAASSVSSKLSPAPKPAPVARPAASAPAAPKLTAAPRPPAPAPGHDDDDWETF